MYTPGSDEKLTPVMIYTSDALVRGEVVTKQNVLRVNIWLRTEVRRSICTSSSHRCWCSAGAL